MLITSLKNQKEFDLVNKSGKKFHSPYFLAIIAKNSPKVITYLSNKKMALASTNQNDNNVFYFGMKVGKKLGNAVTRNKIKRRIRHLITLIANDNNGVNTQISNKKIISKCQVFAFRLLSELC